jgi:hypothetical protein
VSLKETDRERERGREEKEILNKIQGPEIGTSSADWAQLSRLLPEDGGRVQSPKCCFYIKKMDGICPKSQSL